MIIKGVNLKTKSENSVLYSHLKAFISVPSEIFKTPPLTWVTFLSGPWENNVCCDGFCWTQRAQLGSSPVKAFYGICSLRSDSIRKKDLLQVWVRATHILQQNNSFNWWDTLFVRKLNNIRYESKRISAVCWLMKGVCGLMHNNNFFNIIHRLLNRKASKEHCTQSSSQEGCLKFSTINFIMLNNRYTLDLRFVLHLIHSVCALRVRKLHMDLHL